MSNIADYQQKAELIKTARRQLYAEYLGCQKLGYNTWVTEVDVARRASKSLPGSPLLKPFPTEPDIIAKALELYNATTVANAPVAADIPVAAPPAVATYLDKIHEVYSTPIVLLDKVPGEEVAPNAEPTSVPEPEPPSIGAQLAAAYYGSPLDTVAAPGGEISVSDQLSAVYNSKFVEPTMPTVTEISTDPVPESSDTDTEPNLEKLAIDDIKVEIEPEFIVEPETEVILVPEVVEPVESNRSTSGIQQLIAKLLKMDQQGPKNV
jgi:hypothetical protein